MFPTLPDSFILPTFHSATDTKANSSTEQRGTASELPDDNTCCKSKQQNQAQACASDFADSILAETFDFNVYPPGINTNCNILRAREAQGFHTLRISNLEITPAIMSYRSTNTFNGNHISRCSLLIWKLFKCFTNFSTFRKLFKCSTKFSTFRKLFKCLLKLSRKENSSRHFGSFLNAQRT